MGKAPDPAGASQDHPLAIALGHRNGRPDLMAAGHVRRSLPGQQRHVRTVGINSTIQTSDHKKDGVVIRLILLNIVE